MTEFKLDQPAYKEKLQEPRYSHVQQLYAIFRVGKKFTDMKSIEHFQKHMQRLVDVPNARKGNVVNEVLIGSEHVAQLVAEYLKGVNIHKNNVIARELLLTASPQFFRGLPDKELEMWKDENIRFLKDKFGSNCVYAVLHKDETTWHIHALIVPKFYNEQENKYFLSNKRYFDGPEKLREWQDKYADAMHTVFPSLCRGVRYSKS
jgi:hypothetical protein